MVEIREVKSNADIKKFIEFPLELYKDCPYFSPPLYGDEKKLLKTGGKEKTSSSVFYLAFKDGKVVGRIHGILQRQYNEKMSVKQIRFTRFDCIDDVQVAKALFNAVENWGKANGMNAICGPLGFSDLDREGLLIEGFEEYSTFEEQYNYEYYGKLIESCGFRKDADWVEYELKKPEKRNEKLSKIVKRSLEINKIHVADSNMSKRKYIKKYRDGFFETLDACYSHLYGTVKIPKKEQDELINQFMMIVNKKYLMFLCDENDKVIGFGLCFPAIGQAVRKSGGRLTPAALVRILKAVRRPKTLDLGLIGIRPEYQKLGANAIFIEGMIDMLGDGVVEKFETNLNLETNTAVQAQWKHFTARQHKRRRSYIKEFD